MSLESTHWENCWQVHIDCAATRVTQLREIVRIQRHALARLAVDDMDKVVLELAEAILEETHDAV